MTNRAKTFLRENCPKASVYASIPYCLSRSYSVGRLIPSRLYTVNQHDVLTGSQADGTAFPPDKDMTCGNWTKSGEGNAMLGHADRMGLRDDDASKSWNTSHPSRACDAASLVATGGAGLLYCFAAN